MIALVIAHRKLVSGRILASCILTKVAPKFGGQALFSRFTLNTQNTLSSTEPTITTIDAIGTRDIAFKTKQRYASGLLQEYLAYMEIAYDKKRWKVYHFF